MQQKLNLWILKKIMDSASISHLALLHSLGSLTSPCFVGFLISQFSFLPEEERKQCVVKDELPGRRDRTLHRAFYVTKNKNFEEVRKDQNSVYGITHFNKI